MSLYIIASICFFLLFIPLWKLLQLILKYKSFHDVIDKIPGPKANFLFGNVLQFKINRREFTYQMMGLVWTYGYEGIFRVWVGPVPIVLLTRAHTAEPLLSSNKLIEKSSNYNFLKNWIGTGLLVSFVDVFCRQANILVEQLQPLVDQKISFNIYPYISRCTLDIICESAMGVHANAQKNHKSEYVQAVVKMCEIVFKYERMPWLWIKPVFNVMLGKQYESSLRVLRNFVETVIRERIEERNKFGNQESVATRKRLAFLDLLLNMQEEHKLTYEDIREEVDTFMFEGHDTSSASISWTIYLLGQNQHIQDKVHEELNSIFSSDTRDPTEDDLKEMRYLECVVKESLRIYASVPLYGRKTTENFETGGYTIPSGTNVFVTPLPIHTDDKIWGDNVAEFQPERFLLDVSAGRHPYAYVPFSAGSRNCIGQKFALMEEKILLSTILRKFHVTSLDPPTFDKMAIPDLVLRPINGIKVRLTAKPELIVNH